MTDGARETLTIAGTARRIREGVTTAEAVTAACLERIATLNPSLNAFVTVLADRALADAARADRERRAGVDRGLLHGMPLSLKDLIDLAGTPTTAASRVRLGSIARKDAPVVERLRQAGAVFVGKCNLHEFAYGTTSDESAFGPVRHPRDPERSPGGSSGGSAVAVATGMCAGSIGTDTGGSIRIPAALCGLVGLKPGYGDLPCTGVVPLSWSLDHVGPITQTVDDAWILFNAMRGRTPPTIPGEVAPLRARLGVPRAYFLDVLADEVRARFDEAVARLRAAGADIEEVWLPHSADAGPIYVHVQAPEAAAYHAPTLERVPDAYMPPVRMRLEAGRYLLAEDYVRAQRGRVVLRREVDAALSHCEALLVPAVPITAPRIGEGEIDVGGRREPARSLMLRLTQLFNLTGHPAIALPAGAGPGGFPCAIQLVGAHGGTERLLWLARACEHQIA
jgi:aspartyl-tRNA(Asn)/glutamyl-tRNA(Gln) amidotransferase subunit A